jgi:hypothetical protein
MLASTKDKQLVEMSKQPLNINWHGIFKYDQLINFDDPSMKEIFDNIVAKILQ